jgi:hypothetical protein
MNTGDSLVNCLARAYRVQRCNPSSMSARYAIDLPYRGVLRGGIGTDQAGRKSYLPGGGSVH